MIVGGLAELAFGVKAERQRLEGIAKPLTAVERAVRTTATRAAEAGARAARPGPEPLGPLDFGDGLSSVRPNVGRHRRRAPAVSATASEPAFSSA
jgi:hypothetical protein